MTKLAVKTPLRFVPFLRPMVWGGRRLADYVDEPLPAAGPYGEAWLASDHPLHRSTVAAGPLAGRSLRDLMEADRTGLLGPGRDAGPVFPWLIKLLDVTDWLSVQVHPDTTAVRRLWPGEGSKTEAWFVLHAEPGSRIYAGLLPGVGPDDLRGRLREGNVAACLHAFEPRPGDCVFLPAGTVHAVGGGVLMAEVQQTSDATFRLFDWNRRDTEGKSRQLHIEESLASVHWDGGPVHPLRAAAWDEPVPRAGQARWQRLADCLYFVLDHLDSGEPLTLTGDGRVRAVIVLRGAGALSGGDSEHVLRQGQAWILPASVPAVTLSPAPHVSALVATLP
jgi:mannose-6-phosphate isomerase